MKSITKILSNDLFGGIIILLIFFLLLLTSCASNDARTQALLAQRSAQGSSSQPDRLNSELAQKGLESRKFVASASNYRVGPEDLLEISVFQADELKSEVRVNANGSINLKLIDSVQAEGLTVNQLEAAIAKKLEKYLKQPMVSVFIKEYRSQQISVLGSVKNPQIFFVTGQKYLLDMISMAGGLAPEGGSLCVVQTVEPKTGERIKVVIDLDKLLEAGNYELNIPVYSGDVIQIPKSGVIFVDGAVRNPGDFQLRTKTTLTQAISMAKGFDFSAIRSDVKIYRDNGKPEREILTFNYDDIISGKKPDIDLKDKDFIYVSESGFKKFIRGITGAIGGSGSGVGFKPF